MAGIKVKVNFSFWVMMLLAIALKKAYFATMYTIAVVLHELSHYFVASRLFYKCNSIQVDIFGAVLYGEFFDVTPSHRIKIALAGPLTNLAMCLCCLALWWIIPDMYVFTEVFFSANLSMALVNLLPLYPLDGGRVLTGLLQHKCGQRALAHVKKVTVAFSLLLFAIFVISLFTRHNLFSLGLFAICLFSGVLTKSGGEIYTKTTFTTNKKAFLRRGMEKKTLVFDVTNNLSSVVKRMQGNYLYCLEIVDDNMQVIATFSVADLEKIVVTCPLDTPLKMLPKLIAK